MDGWTVWSLVFFTTLVILWFCDSNSWLKFADRSTDQKTVLLLCGLDLFSVSCYKTIFIELIRFTNNYISPSQRNIIYLVKGRYFDFPCFLMSEMKFVIFQRLLTRYFYSLLNKAVRWWWWWWWEIYNSICLNIHFFAVSCKYTLYWKWNNCINFCSSSDVLGLILLLSWPDIFLAK